MGHIHTKPGEYDHTASAFVIKYENGVPKLLLHLHKKLGRYMQFGGHIETTETPWQAVKHELLEESGYEMSQLKILQPKVRMKKATGTKMHPVPIYHKSHVFNETHFHTDLSYALVTDQNPVQEIGEDESTVLKLLTREELESFPEKQLFESVREAGIFVFDVCLKEWEEVDPATFD